MDYMGHPKALNEYSKCCCRWINDVECNESKRETHCLKTSRTNKKNISIFLSQFFPLSAIFRSAYWFIVWIYRLFLYIYIYICLHHIACTTHSFSQEYFELLFCILCIYTVYAYTHIPIDDGENVNITTNGGSQSNQKREWLMLGLLDAFVL